MASSSEEWLVVVKDSEKQWSMKSGDEGLQVAAKDSKKAMNAAKITNDSG